ncbi:unnamed protein product [Diatraea saccharalis]|uniref:hydroxymethylbilane synthase n=1 Tax=Diatraea saccharalis TaxID=40085 RepID=A0A9N9WEU0_9NEOP|nr:unnamed protein product [Diatraea saccharalis]
MEKEPKDVIRVGSRKSELALIQTNHVIDLLKTVYPEKEFTIVTMTTLGDRILNVSLPKIGEKSLFTKDLEDALRNNTVDFVVHSLKDLPTTLPEKLTIGAVFEREDPRDALVLRDGLKDTTLSSLPAGSVIGTSSLRRTAQLRGSYPHLSVVDVRGNLNTRLRKLDAEDGQYSALLLASAGLHRMGWAHRISKILPCAEMKYAVGQGALAVECCVDNYEVLSMLAPFNHPETYCRVLTERSFLKTLGGGCSAPVGVSTRMKKVDDKYKLSITGAVWSLDGTTQIEHSLEHAFTKICKSSKHRLTSTEENGSKKIKTDESQHPVNLVEEHNRRISERSDNLNCEDTRSRAEIETLQEDAKIFCGLIENSNMPFDVIEKCDSLGKELADVLISKGALEVMKVTQDLIRNSIATES